MSFAARRLLLVALLAPLAACVMVPRTEWRYDADCHVIARHMTLQPVQIASIAGCNNNGCATMLAAAGATAAASTVISGSIAIVGNVVYWVERQGNCLRARETVPPALPEATAIQPAPAAPMVAR